MHNMTFFPDNLYFLYDRAATIVATSEGVVWGLDRVTFRKILLKNAAKKVRLYFLRYQCSFFFVLLSLLLLLWKTDLEMGVNSSHIQFVSASLRTKYLFPLLFPLFVVIKVSCNRRLC